MKVKLLRYNSEPLELDTEHIRSISGISQSNTIVAMKNGKTHQGIMVKFD